MFSCLFNQGVLYDNWVQREKYFVTETLGYFLNGSKLFIPCSNFALEFNAYYIPLDFFLLLLLLGGIFPKKY